MNEKFAYTRGRKKQGNGNSIHDLFFFFKGYYYKVHLNETGNRTRRESAA